MSLIQLPERCLHFGKQGVADNDVARRMGLQGHGDDRLVWRQGCCGTDGGRQRHVAARSAQAVRSHREGVQDGALDEAILNQNVKRILEMILQTPTSRDINTPTSLI